MAIVLKVKGKKNVTLYIRDKDNRDCGYNFLGDDSSPATGGMSIIMNDDHAAILLKQYGDELEKVAEARWPEVYKDKVKAYEEARQNEARILFPDIFEMKTKGEKK